MAGGGSLISFPVLTLGLGLPSIPANATNTVGLWPGSLSGALGFRNLFAKTGHHLKLLWAPTLVGSILGAYFLLHTNAHTFDLLVPVLILLGASLLAFQPQVKRWAAGRHRGISPVFGAFLQFLVSIYGGYFGAGMGIMMLAAFSLYVDGDIHEQNAIKNVLGLLINFAASIVFFAQPGVINLTVAVPLIVGSVIGGYASAIISQRIDANKLRVAIVIYAFAAAAYFVYKAV